MSKPVAAPTTAHKASSHPKVMQDSFKALVPGCAMPQSQWLARNDGPDLHLLNWGGDGPPVVLLHGGALSAHTWSRLCALVRQDYRCIALDLRGHGDSDWADSYRIEECVDDVAYAIETMGVSRPHLVGMSLGGIVSAYLVLNQGASRFSSLALVDVAPGVSFAATRKLRDFVDAPTVQQGVPALVDATRALGSEKTDAELIYRYTSLVRPHRGSGWAWKQDRRVPIDYAHILDRLALLRTFAASLSLPVLVARGALSKMLSSEAALDFARRTPTGECHIIPAAGHSIQEDNPLGLADVLCGFWRSTG
ncbi:MAG: alpha/beta hydrolase [Pseudomonadota bacterium]